jgi:hypothetical protein
VNEKAIQNEWLQVKPDVVLTPSIEPVIIQLEEWYRQFQCHSYVTSGLRDPQSQFRIIQRAAIAHRLTEEFPKILGANLLTMMNDGSKMIPVWIPVWSRLLSIGYLVNPPQAACCLYDYDHPSGKHIPAGTLIQPSPHFKGTAFDIGGAGESADKTIQDELDILKRAFESGTIPDLLDYTIERDNNCLHCDCKRRV